MTNYIRPAIEKLPGNWWQGSTSNMNQTRYCGLGWVQKCFESNISNVGDLTEHMRSVHKQYDAMNYVAEEQYPERITGMTGVPFADFNDHPETTEEEVVAVMEKAAMIWDEENE